jgi:hypothetical protein
LHSRPAPAAELRCSARCKHLVDAAAAVVAGAVNESTKNAAVVVAAVGQELVAESDGFFQIRAVCGKHGVFLQKVVLLRVANDFGTYTAHSLIIHAPTRTETWKSFKEKSPTAT